MRQQKILITGGAGFIGSEVVRLLSKANEVIVFDNFSTGLKSNVIKSVNVKVEEGDIRNPNEIANCFTKNANIDCVIHLAATHFIPYCNSHVNETLSINVTGTNNILSAMKDHKINRLIFSSSAAVYKPSERPLSELSETGPIDIYGLTKEIGELAIQEFSRIFGVHWTILRFFNTCGANDPIPHLIPSLIKQASISNKIVLGNLNSRRDYVRKEDVARAVMLSYQDKRSINKIYNVGSGKTLSVKEVFDLINSSGKLTVESNDAYKRRADASKVQADIGKIRRELGWQPKHTIEEFLLNHENSEQQNIKTD